jgi:hypothetical protein
MPPIITHETPSWMPRTTLLDLAKCGVAQPGAVIDVTRLQGLSGITVDEAGAHSGALARMAQIASHPGIRERPSHCRNAGALGLAADPQHGGDPWKFAGSACFRVGWKGGGRTRRCRRRGGDRECRVSRDGATASGAADEGA